MKSSLLPKYEQKIVRISANSKENPKKFPKNSQDFENIQFPTLHLEAENPFGLVCSYFGRNDDFINAF
jgi:uncharacterized protein YozE (UPF0346 family)